jgi:hypothetical protein
MQSFLALTLLVASCMAQQQYPTTRNMYGDMNDMDLLKYQGPYSSQFYGQPLTTPMRGLTTMNMEKLNQLTRYNRFIRALQQTNPDLVQQPQQFPSILGDLIQKRDVESGLTTTTTLGQLLRTELLKQYLLGQIQMTNDDLILNRIHPTTNNYYNNNINERNLLTLMWTQPRLMAAILLNNQLTKREELNNLFNNNQIPTTTTTTTPNRMMMPIYEDQTTRNFKGLPLLNNLPIMNRMMPIYGDDQTTTTTNLNNNGMLYNNIPQMNRIHQNTRTFNNRMMPITFPTTMNRMYNNGGEYQTARNNFNGLPITTIPTMNQMDYGTNMMMMNKQTPTTFYGRPIPMNKIIKTLIITKPILKEEITTDKKVEEKTIDPILGQEDITTGDVKIVDTKIIPTTPEEIRVEPTNTVIDNMNTQEEMMLTQQDNKGMLAREAMMKKINLIKKIMSANKRFTKFNGEQQQEQRREEETAIPMMTIISQTDNERPRKEMMTGAEEGTINRMNRITNMMENDDEMTRARRQSRFTPIPLERQQIFTVDPIPSTSFEYSNTQPILENNQQLNNGPMYTFNGLDRQQQLLQGNNPLRYTINTKRETPTMTYTTTGENGLFTVPLTPGNTHIGTGFNTGNTRYTMPTMTVNTNDQVNIGA